MTKTAATKLTADCNKASKDFDDNNTVVKVHTIKIGDNSMQVQEMASGYIKADGNHIANSYDKMTAMMDDSATITTEEV